MRRQDPAAGRRAVAWVSAAALWLKRWVRRYRHYRLRKRKTDLERACAIRSGGEDRSRTDLDGFAGRPEVMRAVVQAHVPGTAQEKFSAPRVNLLECPLPWTRAFTSNSPAKFLEPTLSIKKASAAI